jgi:SAM-dependent methyltransferase
MTATAELDMGKLEAFGAQMSTILNSSAAALMMSLGHRVGLFDTMAAMPSATSAEIAAAAGLDERYVREWLGAMVTAGVVEYESARASFRLPPEHAAMTTRGAGTNNFASIMQLIPLLGAVEEELIDKFRNGGGVPYSSYTRFQAVMAEMSGAVFDASLVDATLPLVPGVVGRLRDGIEVADIATGSGHAINVMAKAFPNSRFVGYDFSEEGVAVGRKEAADWGLTNATFEAKDVATLAEHERFDFITTFDAVHDQAKPREVVRAIHDALKPGGYWLCVDVQASSHVGENIGHPVGTFGYTVSCMHCMTVSLAYDGEGLGAMWGVHQARDLFSNAGFVDIQVLTNDGDPFNNYYVCRKAG